MLGLRVNMLSDQGYAYADAQPSKLRAGLFHIVTGSYDIPGGPRGHRRRLHQQGARRSPTAARSGSPRPRSSSSGSSRRPPTSSGSTRPSCAGGTSSSPSSSPHLGRFVYDSGNYEGLLDKALEMLGYEDLKAEQARARDDGKLIGIGLATFTEVVGAGEQGLRHPRPEDVRLGRAAGPPDRQGDPQDRRPDPGPGPARRPSPRSSPTSSASRPPTSWSSTATPTTPPTGWAPTPPGAPRRPGRPRPWSRASCATRPGSWPPTCWRSPRGPGGRRPLPGPGRPDRKTTIQEAAFAAYTNHPQGWRRAWRGSPTTTRPT